MSGIDEQDGRDAYVSGLTVPDRMASLRPRDTALARAHTQRYSRLVGSLRWILPLIVLLGLGALIVWPMIETGHVSAVMVDNVPNLMIEKLNLTGTDTQGQAYALTAERALQAANTRNLVDLEKPKGELALEGGAWVAGHADRGRVDQESKKLWLGGHVELFHDEGYRFSSEEMNVDMPQSTAWGDKPVLVQGPMGTMTGTGFRLLDGGKTVVITGPAQAKLDLQRLSGSGKAKQTSGKAK